MNELVLSAPAESCSQEPDSGGRVIDKLAALAERTILDEGALANALNVCRRTIRNMVERGELPPPVPFAGRSSWIVGKILAHFEKRSEDAARAADRAAKKLQGIT